jgi:hypothetical protein
MEFSSILENCGVTKNFITKVGRPKSPEKFSISLILPSDNETKSTLPIRTKSKKKSSTSTNSLTLPSIRIKNEESTSQKNSSSQEVLEHFYKDLKSKRKSYVQNRQDDESHDDMEVAMPLSIRRASRKIKSLRARAQASVVSSDDELSILKKYAEDDEKWARVRVRRHAENIICNLPMKYLLTQPGYKQYAYERAINMMITPFLRILFDLVKKSFKRWKNPVYIMSDEKRIGCMVISKAFMTIGEKLLKKKFRKWAYLYSRRYEKMRRAYYKTYVITIQKWYRSIIRRRKQPLNRLAEVIQACLHRRRAIKTFVYFEACRRQSLNKIRRAIARRRRYYLAARKIQRTYRWVLSYRRMKLRLTRSIARRKILRWYRRVHNRDPFELFLIHIVVSFGGYSRVMKRMPRKILESYSFLMSVNFCVHRLQRFWFHCCDRLAAFMAMIAEKEREAHRKLRLEAAIKIQRNFRAYLWKLTLLAAKLNNRARRIYRAIRSYRYRKNMYCNVIRGRHLRAIKIQRFMKRWCWMKYLQQRFEIRKLLHHLDQVKRNSAALCIQRSYRRMIARRNDLKSAMKRFYQAQRQVVETINNHASTIQRNWILTMAPELFPGYVYRVCERIIAKQEKELNNCAFMIQKLVRQFLKRLRICRIELENNKAQIIQGQAKVRDRIG